MADPVEIDMERKEELIMAKRLRACRVTILPKAPGKCFIPEEVAPPKQKAKREATVQISMKQAASKKPPGAPSPAAIAAATNPVALRYWNQCLANSSKGPLTLPKDDTSPPSCSPSLALAQPSLAQPSLAQQQDTAYPPWVLPAATSDTPVKVEKSEVAAKPKIVVPDMTRRVARPLSDPLPPANSAVLDAVLSEEEERGKPPFPRFQKPWQLHNQRQATFVKERNSSFGGKTRGSEYFNQAKDVDLVTSRNKVSDSAKKEKVEDKMVKASQSGATCTGENVASSGSGQNSQSGRAQPLHENSQPSSETVLTSSCKSIIYEESEKVGRNGISGAIAQDEVPATAAGGGGGGGGGGAGRGGGEVGSCCCTSIEL